MPEPKSINLFHTDGASEKVYIVQLEDRPDGWAVTFQYGCKGGELTAGEKATGLTQAQALKAFDELLAAQCGKGYEPRTGQSVNLFYTEGSSDKVYSVQIEKRDDGWAVAFQYGRRGKALTPGEKGTGLRFDKALKIYEKLVGEKVAKGYTEAESGAVFTSSAFAGQVTGFQPALMNEISIEEARALGDDWLFQEKHDGERRGMKSDATRATYSNRRGLETGIQAPIDAAFARLAGVVGPMELDGEDMGGHVVIFDVLEHFMLRDGTFRERAAILAHLDKTIADLGLQEVLHVEVPVPASEFFARHEARIRERGGEGFVGRHADGLYQPGKPASGGNIFKVKYWEDATCRVTAGRDGKRSVGLEMLDAAGSWIEVGNVTVPANAAVPAVGSLIDVKYLYAYPGGSLFQPVFKCVRTDLPESDCDIGRLKFKSGPETRANEQDMAEDAAPGL
ncbi:WGR domain-containing protein [Cereibacter sphaeroides]|uniref:WGR domain-containing protein n=1 Tax=Cereibacter sphaeroides TaxID=1063 RepID=UPI001F3F37FA|nr:WGR domain-containing protein [Cereibacter sphaeroides]MCE6958783.1 WGR domain-containing protein [Cereibacter sphaeroides]MCE6973343.1 WGR domain-containing protein [Cereibacter sphaeroides]